jgi:hypothetical protein
MFVHTKYSPWRQFPTDEIINLTNVLTSISATSNNAVSLWRQVRNKWLRILETTGGRAGNMTGANTTRHTPSADSASASGSYNSAASRGRGRGRGAQRGRGGRGGSRVIPRQPAPPALVRILLCTSWISRFYFQTSITQQFFPDCGTHPMYCGFRIPIFSAIL